MSINIRRLVLVVCGLGGEFLGQRIVGALLVPKDAGDPPALAVEGEFDTVDPTGEGRFGWGVAGFVAAKNMSNVAEGVDTANEWAFEKTVLRKIGASSADILFSGVGTDADV